MSGEERRRPTGTMSGPQRAAALMLALGEERAARLLARLHDDEVRDISAAMASLGTVRAATVEDLCRDFTEQLGQAGSLVGSWETTERSCRRRSSRPACSPSAAIPSWAGPAWRPAW